MGKKTERIIEHRLEKTTQLPLRGKRRIIPLENYREVLCAVTVTSFVKTGLNVNVLELLFFYDCSTCTALYQPYCPMVIAGHS